MGPQRPRDQGRRDRTRLKTRTVEGPVNLAAHDYGGEGPDLLLVHATGFCGRLWEPWVGRLRQSFHVVAMDQRGHGESEGHEGPFGWAWIGRDIVAVIKSLGLSEVVGVGHSSGGAGLAYAAVDAPQLFSRLVLLDPVMPPQVWRDAVHGQPNSMAEAARRRRASFASTDEFRRRLRAPNSPFANWSDEFLDAYVEHGTRPDGDMVTLRCPPEVEAQMYEQSQVSEGFEKLPLLTVPTTLVMGDTSYVWPKPSLVEEINPLVGTEVVEGGHFFPQEHPDSTLATILRLAST